MREIIGDLLVIAFALILLLHFSYFWAIGWVLVGESNRVILGFETAMAVAILVLGIERYRDDMRRRK